MRVLAVVRHGGRDVARRRIRGEPCDVRSTRWRRGRVEYSLCAEMRRRFLRVADDHQRQLPRPTPCCYRFVLL